jgi:hypothetical protein
MVEELRKPLLCANGISDLFFNLMASVERFLFAAFFASMHKPWPPS